jgi:dipeptidyl aminopeptidase/acylaminoacyl peptidase
MRIRAVALWLAAFSAAAHGDDSAAPAALAPSDSPPATASAPAPTPEPPTAPGAISVDDFARHPAGTLPALSPDGSQIAIVYRAGDRRAIAVQKNTEEEDAAPRILGAITSRPLWTRWTKNDRVLVAVERFQHRVQLEVLERDPDPPLPIYDRRGRIVGYQIPPPPPRKEIPPGRIVQLHSFNAVKGGSRYLARHWQVPVRDQADVVSWLDADPKRVLVSLDEIERFASRRVERPAVASMSVTTGGLRNHVRADRRVQRWFADANGEVRLGETETGISQTTLYQREGKKLKEISTYVEPLEASARFAAYGDDPDVIYAWAPIEGRQALIRLRLSDGTAEGVYAHPKYDVTGPLVFDASKKKLVAVGYVDDTTQLHVLDEALAAEREQMARALPGRTLEVVSETADKKLALVCASSDVAPPSYYVFDRAKREMRQELQEFPRLEREALSPMTPVRYFARDGREIPAYLTLPAGGAKGGPAIVLVHDGPDQRAQRRFDPLVQWLARSGFAVLEPNYRGSSGYGIDHRSAGLGEWGASMQADLEDAAKWLASEGIADAGRIGIYGRGYGGYAALMGAVSATSPFRAAVAYGAPTDLEMLLEDDERERSEVDWSTRVMGARKIKRARLLELSPITYAGSFARPVLLMHPEYDERVPLEHAESLVKAAKKAGKTIELVEFESEVHELAREANRVLWFEKLAEFFQRTLAASEEKAT